VTISRVLLTLTKIALIPAYILAAFGQSTATLFGRIFDPTAAVVPGAVVTMRNLAIGEQRTVQTDRQGNYQFAALRAGHYSIEVNSDGFQPQIVENVAIEVGRTVMHDFRLQIAAASERVTVTTDSFIIERGTSSVGHVIDQQTVQEIPLNGRYFLDLGLLVAGSVTPSTNGFSTTPSRGVANTLRPNVTGRIRTIGRVDQWFDTLVFVPAAGFGNLGRNVITGPSFNNTDLSVTKNAMIGDRTRVQLRTEFFDLFNHTNFGAPGIVVGTPAFGQITSTRFPTGESGSSRQIQFAVKLDL